MVVLEMVVCNRGVREVFVEERSSEVCIREMSVLERCLYWREMSVLEREVCVRERCLY